MLESFSPRCMGNVQEVLLKQAKAGKLNSHYISLKDSLRMKPSLCQRLGLQQSSQSANHRTHSYGWKIVKKVHIIASEKGTAGIFAAMCT